jgi:hypothetical protein
MAPGAADGAFTVRRKLGQEFPGFLFVAIGTDGVFGLGVHRLQEHKIFPAGFTGIFIKRHMYNSSNNDCND